MSSTINIHYLIYEATEPATAGAQRKLTPVTSEGDVALQKAIEDSDTNKLVSSVGTVAAQNAILHEHVTSVPFDLPIQGYMIQLDKHEESIWEITREYWIKVLTGGAIYYPVNKEKDHDRLFLAVWTEGAKAMPNPTPEPVG